MASNLEERITALNQPVRQRLAELFGGRKRPKEVYGLLSEFLSVEGKLLRPSLCLAACTAVGGKKGDAVPAAAAIEMFHNFTLIHDDIEDSSQMRRGNPCLHVKYGLPLALNAGDGLFMMVWQQALLLRGENGEDAQRRLLSAFTKVLEGQAVELGWYQENKWDVSEEEYYTVVRGKTGALIAASCEVGGLLGGADGKTCKALYEFGMGLGVGFQIIDDVLNVVGNEEKYGKEIGGDIYEGKRTLITLNALRALKGKDAMVLEGLLRKEKKSAADVLRVIALLKKSGATDKASRIAEDLVSGARKQLAVLPENEGKALLLQLAGYITERER